jgi:hypothetical protein
MGSSCGNHWGLRNSDSMNGKSAGTVTLGFGVVALTS